MPFLRAEAPPGTPEEETIEYLLGRRHTQVKHRRKIKTYGEITDEQRAETGLVQWGKRRDVIPGDPYGLWRSWAGNLSHHRDDRMLDILPPIFDKVMSIEDDDESPLLYKIRYLLSRLSSCNDICKLALDVSTRDDVYVLQETEEELVVEFSLLSKTVRLMRCWDIDLNKKNPFDKTQRCKDAEQEIDELFTEAPMATEVQQLLMARIIAENGGSLRSINNQQHQVDVGHKDFSKDLHELRSEAQERFWLLSTEAERDALRQAAQDGDDQVDHIVTVLKANWPRHWTNGRYDPDLFRHHLRDKIAAEKVWELVDADVFVVLDAQSRVVFANVEEAAQLLFGGPEIVPALNRAIDLYSFFVPIRAPEARRHAVDRHIRRAHPELDPARANLAQLQNVKMGVAHYGYWNPYPSLEGRHVFPSEDCFFSGTRLTNYPRKVFPGFCEAVLGKASAVIRLLLEKLDPTYYRLSGTMYDRLPKEGGNPIRTNEEDFLSMFVLGINAHTQRHRDTSDVRGGYAGLFTLGQYTGGNLCIPQLGIKVPYAPGACALLRGDRMDHLVADYTGPRYFVTGTHHESVRQYAMNQMPDRNWELRRIPRRGGGNSDDDKDDLESSSEEDEEEDEDPPSDVDDPIRFPLETPCINDGADSDDSDDPPYTNWELHWGRALNSSDSSSYS
ncbi:hypothetical protein PG991_012304 [Apiospora marii]|uniref:Prolyl 4-hydroxylase alpha subunit domain-containing protein n=1 Tax=Apiospora marii TaxID=335849 RepID=A0ABR1R9N8_9PEZI